MEILYFADGNGKLDIVCQLLKKVSTHIHLPRDPAIPTPCLYKKNYGLHLWKQL
jgi:hypothetical protein